MYYTSNLPEQPINYISKVFVTLKNTFRLTKNLLVLTKKLFML